MVRAIAEPVSSLPYFVEDLLALECKKSCISLPRSRMDAHLLCQTTEESTECPSVASPGLSELLDDKGRYFVVGGMDPELTESP